MKHTVIALVENEPGVLNRVASLFRRRNFNIDSLTVGRTENPEVSRMTIVLDSDVTKVPQVIGNLYKLVNVIKVIDVTEQRFFSRDLALIKVKASTEVGALADKFGARIIDLTDEMMMIEISDEEHRIESLVEALKPIGIVELVRTGVVAMGRGDLTLKADAYFESLESEESAAQPS
jgi:acetolactate synthase-1/3 small subunit